MRERSQRSGFFCTCCLLFVGALAICTLSCSKKTAEDKMPPIEKPLYPVNVNGLLGYVDRTGRFVIKPRFTRAGDFHGGVAQVNLGYRWWYIDEDGVTVSEDRLPAFKISKPSQEGIAAVESGGKWGDDRVSPAYIRGKWGFIDKTGKVVIKPRFGYASEFREGLAVVQLVQPSPNWCFIDKTGRCIGNRQFSSVRQFQEGLAAVALGGEYFPHSDVVYGRIWGFIDKTGEFVISPQYVDVIADFHKGLASVIRDVIQPCLIDKTGKVVAEPHW